jgi:MoaA/NifB/PqqE/SkfB family radical SAM enzyme
MARNLINTGRLAFRSLLPGKAGTQPPYKLNLMVTSRCNQRCQHCGIWARKAADLPLELLRKLLRSTPKVSWLDITGGEIFLQRDIEDLFEIILTECRNLALLHFPTNGTLADEAVRLAAKLADTWGPKIVITVSLDGPPEVHNATRGSEDAFEAAMDCWLRLKEIDRCQSYLGFTASPANVNLYGDTLAAIREFAPWAGPGDLHVNLLNASGHYYGDIPCEAPDAHESTQLIREVMAARKATMRGQSPMAFVEKRYLELALTYLETGKTPIKCRALDATCFIDAHGTVYPCVQWDQPLGNLYDTEGDLMPIWESAEAVQAREIIASGDCPNCWTPCEAIPAILAGLLSP